MVKEMYYGSEGKPKNPFRNCKSPSEVFNLSRRISLEQSGFLNRIGVICDNEGHVQLKGEKHKILDPESLYTSLKEEPSDNKAQEAKDKSTDLAQNKPADMEKYYKRNFFLPFPSMLSTISSQFLQQEGVKIEPLKNKKVYCRRGVGFG